MPAKRGIRTASGTGQGTTSAFPQGKAYGLILGIIAALKIPLTNVPAATWKRALAVPSDKDGARARASQLLPHLADCWKAKGAHGRAEAALLALYGAKCLLPYSFTARPLEDKPHPQPGGVLP